jgi:hypothetical protein
MYIFIVRIMSQYLFIYHQFLQLLDESIDDYTKRFIEQKSML